MSFLIENSTREIWLSTGNPARSMDDCGLHVVQTADKTLVYSGNNVSGKHYCEHDMPHPRYSLAHNEPKPRHATPELAAKFPAPPGREQFEADIRALCDSFKTPSARAVEAALASLNEGFWDYGPVKVAEITGLPIDEVTSLIVKAGWRQMGHQYSKLGFYEMA